MKFVQQLNTRKIGLLVGLITPLITFLIYGLVASGSNSFTSWLTFIMRNDDFRSNPLTFSLLPNLFFFYLSNFRWRIDNFTFGLVGATLFFSVIVVALIIV